MLTNMSFVADEAASGQEAIEMVRKARPTRVTRYEIAFVDWQMPGMNGIETGRRILRAARSRLSAPHLVMVTAYGREEVLKQAEESGFENVLIKPVTSSILFDTAVVRSRRRRRATETAQAGPSFDIERMRGARVLLVEDNEINQEVAIGQLEDAEVFVDVAENGAGRAAHGARERLRRGADGHADAGDGRHRGDAHRSGPTRASQTLPIVAMTANAMVSDRKMCLEAGMNDHIAKPIDPDQLFGTLLRWIRRTDGNGRGSHVGTKRPASAKEVKRCRSRHSRH